MAVLKVPWKMVAVSHAIRQQFMTPIAGEGKQATGGQEMKS
jgi:hypothetical protein